jgi:hypothetical protein
MVFFSNSVRLQVYGDRRQVFSIVFPEAGSLKPVAFFFCNLQVLRSIYKQKEFYFQETLFCIN